MHINELSPELLVMIFSKIDDFSEKIKVERVCRHWRGIVLLDWKTTKTCSKPLKPWNNLKTFGLVLNRCGEWLEELWLDYVKIDGNLVKQMVKQMKCLKHLKLSNCYLNGPAVNSIANSFGQQLYSFILDETEYLPNMRRLIENNSSNLEHLNLYDHHSHHHVEIMPTKLPSNLKSFSLCQTNEFHINASHLFSIVPRDCNNLKILHFQTRTLMPNMILDIGKIKSLVYINLSVNFKKILVNVDNAICYNENAFKNVICNELPNLKALRIGGYCSEETLSNICQARPDLIHLNVLTRHPFQISNSLNSLTIGVNDYTRFDPMILFEQKNESIKHLDIRSLSLLPSSNFIEGLLEQLPNLNSFHCKMPTNEDAELTLFFYLFEKHLVKGKKITIYLHFSEDLDRYYKCSLPNDFSLFKKVGWKPKMCNGKCENLILKKVIKEAIGNNEPSFLSEWWME